MKVKMNKNSEIIAFKDVDENDGHEMATIVFQYNNGKFTVYLNGYPIDDKKFPALQGYYGYTMTDEELNEFIKFLKETVNEKC